VTIKKLTRNNPTMKAKFAELTSPPLAAENSLNEQSNTP
jgi:hypothetical protein